MVDYTRTRITTEKENLLFWSKVRDYIERDIFKGGQVLQIEDFIYDENYKLNKKTIIALLTHLKIIIAGNTQFLTIYY